jgi:hypothetical protein
MDIPLKYFAELRDPRIERNREHLLEEILLIAIAAVLSIRELERHCGLRRGQTRVVEDLSRYYKELGIRNVRLHDVAWTYDNVLDINYIFPDWDADLYGSGNQYHISAWI